MHKFTIQNGLTCLNGKPLLVKGLRCSNGLFSDAVTDDLIRQLKTYTEHGLNTISVFLMGNRYGDIAGYNPDASLNPVYADRLGKIIEAADSLGMVVLVGCLYWGTSKARYDDWTQADVDKAVYNTAEWLKIKNYTNVFIDVDNEGMGRAEKGFDNRALVLAAKSANPDCPVATNYIGAPPNEADLCVHFSDKADGKPYIESEGVPENAPGGYWVKYTKALDPMNYYRQLDSYNNYVNIGIYTDEMKVDQINRTRFHFDKGWGYMLASTWLQAVPPFGPNHVLGGYGSCYDPGIRWWAEFIRDIYGSYSV